MVWYSVKDGDEDYYWNPATGETQWEVPDHATILAAADGSGEMATRLQMMWMDQARWPRDYR